MKRTALTLTMLPLLLVCVSARSAQATGSGSSFKAVPFEFDPGNTDLVAAKWKTGLGCPSNGVLPAFTGDTQAFIDPGCPTTDPADVDNEGLLLAKGGPSSTNASAGATILGVNGIKLTELGYDIRKPDAFTDLRGSHCGAGSPRFNIVTNTGTHFIGCDSPAPIQTTVGAWIRLRWAPAEAFPPIGPAEIVKSMEIVFDDGEIPPDNFGVAIIDNIDINATLIGRGPTRPEEGDQDKGCGGDRDHHYNFHHSSSRPESSEVSYQDDQQHAKVQSISGARSISYGPTAVTFVQDALFNGQPGYVLTFTATDLSGLSTPLLPQIGSYTVLVTGAQGVVYQYTGVVTAGLIKIHPH